VAGYPPSVLAEKESVYIYLHSPANGGHLFKPKSLIAEQSSGGESEYLFSLAEIPVTTLPYGNENTFTSKKWLQVLQNKGVYYLGAFVSANRYAAIREIGFAFNGNQQSLSVSRGSN
jgi:hypothetical protein